MIFTETSLPGAFIIELDTICDERGFFARSWCAKEFAEHGLNPKLVQCNISYNKYCGTIRGMHYQVAPYEEAKIVRCIRGAILDVIIDIRDDSKTFKQWVGIELSATNRRALYVPEGFAHGFQTLEDDTEVFYQMSEFYHNECVMGFRFDDPGVGIQWPLECSVMSNKDSSYGGCY
jgi:dTDP-4-dehydrorhamnose 3,5-epimerase